MFEWRPCSTPGKTPAFKPQQPCAELSACTRGCCPDQPPPLVAPLCSGSLALLFSLSHTQMGVSFPAAFSSHFNSKAKLGGRAASHSQFSLGEKKGDSLDVARERRKLGLGQGVMANISKRRLETPTTHLLRINRTEPWPQNDPYKAAFLLQGSLARHYPWVG